MRRLLLVATMAELVACTALPGLQPGTVSCQPYGYTPAPIAFSVPAGPVTAEAAEQTAVAFVRACGDGAGTIDQLASDTTAGTGAANGPNGGRPVWVVKVDATVTEPGGTTYTSHFWIEVDQVTGALVLIAYG